jgi:hypothetical protein
MYQTATEDNNEEKVIEDKFSRIINYSNEYKPSVEECLQNENSNLSVIFLLVKIMNFR